MQIKGANFESDILWLLQRFGPEALDKVKNALSPDNRSELFERKVLPVSWVDYAAFLNFHIAIDKLFGQGDFTLMHEMIRVGTLKNINAFSKIFFKIASPEYVIKKGLQLWNQYYRPGRVECHLPEANHFQFTILDISEIPEYHEHDIIPSIEAAFELVGAKNIRIVHSTCLNRGDTYCVFDAWWE